MLGIPAPACTLVVHKLPPPIPTLKPSAPHSHKSTADSKVDMLPAIMSTQK